MGMVLPGKDRKSATTQTKMIVMIVSLVVICPLVVMAFVGLGTNNVMMAMKTQMTTATSARPPELCSSFVISDWSFPVRALPWDPSADSRFPIFSSRMGV